MWCTLVVFGTVLASSLAEFPVPRSTIAQPRADSTDYRLPTHTLPVHYDVTLEPFFDTFTFDGRVLIEVDVTEEANNITLHANTLTIDEGNVSITASPDVSVAVANISYDSDKHFVIVYANFSVGTYYLDIPFTGILNSDNSGFYRASYTDEDGNTRWLATTQFEATSARKAFPCFDEPALKAQFTISLVREEAYNSISNMKLNSTQDLGDGRFQDTFERSITMPTYLVAFIVSDFEYVESYQYNRSEAVYARSQMIQDGRGIYPLNISIQILKAMEDYTAIDYHIDKMYQAAIPDSWFAAGAMENWGLVTYRERYLLYKEGVTTSSEKQTITAIISHEYGHQWFGNLVSPSWWIYIWLNEGFATYFEYYATEVVEPSWRMMEQMVIKTLQYAMESDALESTRAMSTDAGSPSEISALFDRVAYDKSGSVIRMMEHFLTTPVFQSGLNKYLIDRSYSYAVPSDLWRGLQEALDESSVTLPDGETVESIMETWNSQAGFPVVYVERNYENGSATFTQSRFLLNNATHELDQIWSIPINYASADDLDFSNTTATHWLTQESSTWDLSLNPESWIIVNKQEGGYYRVNYDATNWALIANYLKSENYGNVHVVNRAQLVDDAFNLARSGRISYTVLLNLAEYISQETDYVPLYSLFRGLTYLNRYLSGTEYYSKFKAYIVDLLQTAYESIGTDLVDGETVTDIYNRNNIISWLCLYGHADCQEKMNNKLASREDIHPDEQANVYCGGMRSGNLSDWQHLHQLYLSNATEELQKSRLLTALGCSLNTEILEKYLNVSLGWDADYSVRSSDELTAFQAVYTGSDVGLELAFDFVLERFVDITESFTTSRISSILSGISTRLTTADQLEKLENFINEQSDEIQTTYSSAFASAVSNLNSNLEWYSRSVSGISAYFDDEETSSSSSSAATTTTTTTTTTTVATTAAADATTETPSEGDGDAAGVAASSMAIIITSFVISLSLYV